MYFYRSSAESTPVSGTDRTIPCRARESVTHRASPAPLHQLVPLFKVNSAAERALCSLKSHRFSFMPHPCWGKNIWPDREENVQLNCLVLYAAKSQMRPSGHDTEKCSVRQRCFIWGIIALYVFMFPKLSFTMSMNGPTTFSSVKPGREGSACLVYIHQYQLTAMVLLPHRSSWLQMKSLNTLVKYSLKENKMWKCGSLISYFHSPRNKWKNS